MMGKINFCSKWGRREIFRTGSFPANVGAARSTNHRRRASEHLEIDTTLSDDVFEFGSLLKADPPMLSQKR